MEFTSDEMKVIEMLLCVFEEGEPDVYFNGYGVSGEDYENLKKKVQGDNYVWYGEDE